MRRYFLHFFYSTLFAVFIFGFTYLPLQDYPVLNYQGFLFNQYFFHGNNFGGFWYLHNYLPPNAISTVVIGLMDIFLDPFLAGKIYLFILALAMYSGIFRYLRFHTGRERNAFASLAFYLTLCLHFLMAYLNFLSGLAVLFHVIVFIRERKWEESILPMALSFLFIYLCHFATFALFSLYFFIYFISEKKYSGLWRMAASAIPSLAIFLHYILNRTIPIVPDTGSYYSSFIDLIHWKFLIFFSPIIPFNVFKWVQDTPRIFEIGDYLFVAMALLLIAYIFLTQILKRNWSFELWLALSTFCLAIILPLDFGGVTPAGERVVVFCILNIVIVFYRLNIRKSFRLTSLIICFIFGILAYSYDMWNTALFNSMVSRNSIPQEAILSPNTKLEGTNGFLHLHFYEDLRKNRGYPYFNIGLFGYPDSLKTGLSQ